MAGAATFGHPPPVGLPAVDILSCEDHDLFREGLRHVVNGLPGPPGLVAARNAAGARRALASDPDIGLVLLDLALPDADGLEFLAEIRAGYPLTGVAIVSASERPEDVRAALDAGAVGYIPKSSERDVLVGALSVVLAGGVYMPAALLDAARQPSVPGLTARQQDVAALLAKGLTNKEIASVLGIGAGTVKTHVAAILRELEVTNRTEAVMELVGRGLVASG